MSIDTYVLFFNDDTGFRFSYTIKEMMTSHRVSKASGFE